MLLLHLFQLPGKVLRIVKSKLPTIFLRFHGFQFAVGLGAVKSFPENDLTLAVGYNSRYLEAISNGINKGDELVVHVGYFEDLFIG